MGTFFNVEFLLFIKRSSKYHRSILYFNNILETFFSFPVVSLLLHKGLFE